MEDLIVEKNGKSLLRVRVEITLDIDCEQFNAEYGTKYSRREIAKEVRESVFQTGIDAVFPPHAGIIIDSNLVNR